MPMRMKNPRKAFISSTVIFVHFVNFSLPMTSLAYLLLSVTISVINSPMKISKTSLGVSGMAVVGPTGELNDLTTGFSVVVHTAGCDGEPGGEVGGDDCGELCCIVAIVLSATTRTISTVLVEMRTWHRSHGIVYNNRCWSISS